MPNKTEYLIETDILVDHLVHDDLSTMSILEIAMTKGICFSSVINASELYFRSASLVEKQNVDKVVYALNILGIHSRYSLNISDFFDKVTSVRDALMCSIALNNKLPLLTGEIERYQKCGIKIITPKELRG